MTVVVPAWFLMGLLVAVFVALIVAASCIEATIQMHGRLRETRRELRIVNHRRRCERRHRYRSAWFRPEQTPVRPALQTVPWPDPEPTELIAVEPGMLGPRVWGTWPDPPVVDTGEAVVVELPLTEPIEILPPAADAS